MNLLGHGQWDHGKFGQEPRMAKQIDQMRKGTTTVAILKLLIDEDEALHGYEIIRRLEARSQGYFRFKEGLIYPSLHRMEQDGLLESQWMGKPGTRRRKVYAVTDKGQQQLEIEMRRWQTFSQRMDQLLGLETT
jgi:DNA-binding PadR family transcriptional regulator